MGDTRLTTDVTLYVNGHGHELCVDNRSTLLDVLREQLGLPGAKKGCDHGQCGACTVLLDGQRINSCLVLAVTAGDAKVTTVEGLSAGDGLHPVQEAFLEHDALQCGFCTPGQVCSAVGLLSSTPSPQSLSEADIREAMSGNLCRCGAYVNITAAIAEVAAR